MHVYEMRKDGEGNRLALAERPEPRPGPNQIVMQVRAVSLNYRDLSRCM